MKNFLKLKTSVLLLIIMGCSVDEGKTPEQMEAVNLKPENLSAKTSGGFCGPNVDFEDLVVETSWISGSTGNRSTFGACGVDNESWMDKYNDGIVMMKCLSGKGHRTELKENTGDESSLSTSKTMTFTAKYTNIAKNGISIAQIHNRGSGIKRPWIRLYIDDDRYIRIKETETNPTGSSSSYSTYTGPKYTSGNVITVTVKTGLSGQSKAEVKVQTNGNSWTKTLSPSSAWSSKSNTYYLKAGVYTEGNDKTCTVKYSYFSINH
ncbi:polysaccharide lyase family 7 protein [Flavivirga aquimarina]|uniref:Polysaccharide lyase family 7 protein n=1 Tax=Flavivirga aquimarina TaxID=2027862 RepID=A0ABT8W7L4_9FLAO|nr:polysaccharide lyase family 7 protein [Flavivirga aquimarina]MDO5969108.1 polysaccharide lyase family 7 protein [Flavivirga aquimarina]